MHRIISFFMLILFNNHMFSYGVWGSVYKYNDHAVLLLGDRHSDVGDIGEMAFKKLMSPYIKRLVEDINLDFILEQTEGELSNIIDYRLRLWADDGKSIPELERFIKDKYIAYKKSIPKRNIDSKEKIKSKILLLKMRSYICEQPILSHLGLLKQFNPEANSYNKFKSCREARHYFQINNISANIILGDWRSSIIHDLVITLSIGMGMLSRNFKIDNILPNSCLIDFDTTYSVNNLLTDPNIFTYFLTNLSATIYYINGYKFRDYGSATMSNLIAEIDKICNKLHNLESLTHGSEKSLWSNFKAKAELVKNSILQCMEYFKHLSGHDKDQFGQIFSWSFDYNCIELHWCAALYSLILKNKSLFEYCKMEEGSCGKILLADIADAGFLSAILDSRKNKRNAVLYAGANHGKNVAQCLIDLGYKKIELFDNINNETPLNKTELDTLTESFYRDART